MMKSTVHLFLTGVLIGGVALGGLPESTARADEGSIYFATGSSELDSKAKATIAKIAKHLAEGGKIDLTPFTDPRGSDDINRELRVARARAVHDALIAAGVGEDQMQQGEGQGGGSAPKEFWRYRRVSLRFDGASKAVAAARAKNEAAARAEAKAHPEPSDAPEADKPVVEKTETTAKVAKTDKAPVEKAEKAPVEKAPADKPAVEKSEKTVVAMNTKPDRPSTTTPKEEPATKNGLEPIRLIYWRALNHALWIVAKEQGFFEQEGFDVSLKEVDDDARVLNKQMQNGDSPAGVMDTAALKKRKFAAGAICGYAVHEAMARGDQVVDIGSLVMITESMLMRKELAAAIDKDIKSFRGKKMGDATYGAGEHDFKYTNILRGQLAKNGLVEKKDYDIIPYEDDNKEMNDLIAGKIDIAKSVPPGDVDFVRHHPEFVRVPLARYFPYVPCCRQLITRQQLKESRGKYVRLLRASIRAHEFIINHPKEAAVILGRVLKISPELVRISIMNAYVNLTPDPMRKGVELYQRANDQFTRTKTSTAEFMDTSLYRDALVSLARENENDPSQKGYYDTMLQRFKQNN